MYRYHGNEDAGDLDAMHAAAMSEVFRKCYLCGKNHEVDWDWVDETQDGARDKVICPDCWADVQRLKAEGATHVFEQAGLGKAPFKVVGVSREVGPRRIAQRDGTVLEVGAPGQPLGTCAYCGQGIAECWAIRSADGKTFTVGCECVRKTGDVGLRQQMNPLKRELRHQREAERIEAAWALMRDEDFRSYFDTLPHPNGWQGKTLLDWMAWMRDNAGNAGKLRVVRLIEKRAKEVDNG